MNSRARLRRARYAGCRGATILMELMDMMHVSRLPRQPEPPYRFAWAFVLALAFVAAGAVDRLPSGGTVSAQAQAPNACALLKVEEIEHLTPKTTVKEGVAAALPAFGSVTCQYTWGVGADRFNLDVIVHDATRIFPGMSPDQIKQRLLESVTPGTHDAVVPEVGE